MIFAAHIIAASLLAQPAPVLVRHEPTLRRFHGVWYRVRKPKPAPPPAPAATIQEIAPPAPPAETSRTAPIAIEPHTIRTIPIVPQSTFEQRWGGLPR